MSNRPNNRNNIGKRDQYCNDYSRNQCSVMIRVDGDEIEIPVNFGLTADEIKRIYPFLLEYASTPIKNPAVDFSYETDLGKFGDETDAEHQKHLDSVKQAASYWYDKASASLLDIAMRFAVDIKLKGIESLNDIFNPVSIIESTKVEPLSPAETEAVIKDMKLETDTDKDFDPGDEKDIPLGIAGKNSVNIYNSTEKDDYLSAELDAMESKLAVNDKFAAMVDKDVADKGTDDYKSKYVPGKLSDEEVKMYDEPNMSAEDAFAEFDSNNGLDHEAIDESPVVDIIVPSKKTESVADVSDTVSNDLEATDLRFEDDDTPEEVPNTELTGDYAFNDNDIDSEDSEDTDEFTDEPDESADFDDLDNTDSNNNDED